MPRRIPIESLTEDHGAQVIEEAFPGEPLPKDLVYIDPTKGAVVPARTVGDLPAGAIEIPRTTWYRRA